MNVLFISNVSKRVGSFASASIAAAKKCGYRFIYASNWSATPRELLNEDEKTYEITIKDVPIARSPFARSNIKAYKQLVKLIQEEKIDCIHCNTPTGGLLGRLAGKRCGVKKVIYQAHGFHFYKGAPLLNWLLYYPVEKWLAHYTDALITINKEDFERAKNKFKLRNHGKVYYVPGVGIDTELYRQNDIKRETLRQSIGVSSDDILLISMGDLVPRKNYKTAIEAVAKCGNPTVRYIICGTGPEKEPLEKLATDLGVTNQVQFLGFRSDIKELLQASDVFLFTSTQEGLARSLMEAMASGLPCLASKIRGNTDLIEGTSGGYLYSPTDSDGFAEGINALANDNELHCTMGKANLKTIMGFNSEAAEKSIETVYTNTIDFSGGGVSDYYPSWFKKRCELGLNIDDYILLAVGRLDKNKNNKVLIQAVAHLSESVHLVLCGEGEEAESLRLLSDMLGCSNRVHFLGNRTDMVELYNMADCYVSSSLREGLSRSLMEAMASGLPCVVSRIRGNVDLVEDGVSGYTYASEDSNDCAKVIEKCMKMDSVPSRMRYALYDIKCVADTLSDIYGIVFNES